METAIRPLPIVTDQLALNFANTVDDPHGAARFDHLYDAPGLAQWASQVGLINPAHAAELAAAAAAAPSRTVGTMRDAHALRDTINEIFAAVAHNRPVPTPPWQELRRTAADAVRSAELMTVGSELRLSWDSSADLDNILRLVAYTALELLTSDQLGRIKQCAGCPWLYLDHSKNATRKWCSMDDCGKHAKIRRYVTKRAERNRTQADTRQQNRTPR